MSFSSWRQFQFFENTPIRDPQLGSDSPLYSDPTLSAVTPLGAGKLAIAVQSTVIKLVDLEKSSVICQYNAYQAGYQITYLQSISDSFIVSVGEYLGKPSSIKVWKMEKTPKDEHGYHSMVEVKNGNNTFPISAICISPDLTCLVIGFINGRIVLVRGDLSRDRGSRQRVIYDDPNREPITALQLNTQSSACFASTTSRIMVFSTTGRNNGKPDLTLNKNTGVDLNCSCISTDGQEFICCSKDSLEFYKVTGEKHSLVIDIPMKKRIYQIDNDHVLIVSGVNSSNSTALNVSNAAASNNRILILDTRNKLVAMNLLISNSVIDIFNGVFDGKSSIFLLASDGVIHKINQKLIEDQLQIVTQRELFPTALQLAAQHPDKISGMKIQEIRKQYGDYLYRKNVKSEAIEQYVQCLDVTETSEIISKFGIEKTSTSDEVFNLSHYLWSLVKRGVGNCDHVTLLLIALTKLKDKDSIDNFISHFSRSGAYIEEGEVEESWNEDDETYFYSDVNLFDLNLVLRLLEEANFPSQAYKLARKFSRDPLIIVDVILTNLNDPKSALRYIKSLPVDDTLRVLITFSKLLLEKLPNDTNALLIKVFTGKYRPEKYEDKISEQNGSSVPHEKTVFHSYNAFMGYMYPTKEPSPSSSSEQEKVGDRPTYHPPRPNLIFTSFINKPFELVVFLEACLESYNEYKGFDKDKQEILTTLYDIYLSLSKEDIPERQNEWRSKAVRVFRESEKLVLSTNDSNKSVTTKASASNTVDNSLMMLISHMNDVDLHSIAEKDDDEVHSELSTINKANLTDTFRSMHLTGEVKNCLKFLDKYGEHEPLLYKMALTFFTSSKHVFREIGGDPVFKKNVLEKIIELDLMSPLDILQVLGSTNVATFGLIQDFLVNYIDSETREIDNNEKLIKSYELELEEKQQKLSEFSRLDTPLQIKTRNQFCHMCHTLLDLPIVYFKCGHTYHQRCLSEEDILSEADKLFKCPQCIVELETSNKMKIAQSEMETKTELLKVALSSKENSKDRFKVVTEFIGRGGLDSSRVTI